MPKPKIVKKLDPDKEFTKVVTSMKKLAKEYDHTEVDETGYVECVGTGVKTQYMIILTGPYLLSKNMLDVIAKSHPRVNVIECYDKDGFFDWASQTYIKDYSCVVITAE